jgi:hypothetical protein
MAGRLRCTPGFETDSRNETANEMYGNVFRVTVQGNGKKNQNHSYLLT